VSRSWRFVVAIVLLGSIFTSCTLDGDKNEPRISNRSGVAVEILWTNPSGDEVHYTNISPGQDVGVYEWPASCTPSNMVAKTGRLLAHPAAGFTLVELKSPLRAACGPSTHQAQSRPPRR
jgi:hypothetical protein